MDSLVQSIAINMSVCLSVVCLSISVCQKQLVQILRDFLYISPVAVLVLICSNVIYYVLPVLRKQLIHINGCVKAKLI